MSEQRPGEWPINEPVDLAGPSGGEASSDPDEIYVRLASERARREIVLASIKAHLEEQPTANAVHAVARHWISDVAAISDQVATVKRRSA